MFKKFIINSIKLILILGLIGGSGLAYIIHKYSSDLPDYSQLKKYYPPSITRMYSADGKLIEEFAKEKRIFVPISSIPKPLIYAFISAEDKNFYSHEGIDVFSIVRAAVTNISHMMNNRRAEGGSTITQQVVKNFLLSSERSLERKIKEAILSYRLTQVFTKDEILELYLNQIYLGKGAYGVAMAALVYFNKSIEELTISESAVLASMPKAPSQYNPERNLTRATNRKNYVISRMYDDGYLTENEAKTSSAESIILAKHDKVATIDADYYAAKVREEVIEMFGEEYFYNAGLTIMTCIDSQMQQAATNALRYGIREYDMKKGFRGALKNIALDNWQQTLQNFVIPPGLLHYNLAIILNVTNNDAKIGLKDGSEGTIFLRDMKWTATDIKSVSRILKIGDVVAVEKVNEKYILRQIPAVNGGIMVMDHETGRVLAAEGGYDFSDSKFDRTIHAKRQPGSSIKPFVYMAALENGAKPNDIFNDAPIEVYQGPGLPYWRPKNFEENFLGPITLRKGLEKSRNTITVRVSQYAGLKKVAEMISRFGINENPSLRHSMVLGALETTLSQMTVAYGIIANGGKKIEPHYIEFIKDRKGNVIYKRDYTECVGCKIEGAIDLSNVQVPVIDKPEMQTVIDEATSYQMKSILMGGVQRGTSTRAKPLKQIVAGKTGTTNLAKDAWFLGFTPKIVVGTYVGFDNPRSMGNRASGATIALPVFINFMENGYKDMPSLDFIVPDTIMLASIDYDTGKPSNASNSIIEAFRVDKKIDEMKIEDEIKLIDPHSFNPFDKIQEIDNSEELY
ncbi:MAG: penicillin-binding protein 1A [Rickettsiales bacterium]|nr:MAG: penicillin-binding protein 1A [Rickettsiales bacterium]